MVRFPVSSDSSDDDDSLSELDISEEKVADSDQNIGLVVESYRFSRGEKD